MEPSMMMSAAAPLFVKETGMPIWFDFDR